MTTPKPKTAWGVYDEDGFLRYWSIGCDKEESINFFLIEEDESWEEFHNRGYRCHEIEIRVTK